MFLVEWNYHLLYQGVLKYGILRCVSRNFSDLLGFFCSSVA